METLPDRWPLQIRAPGWYGTVWYPSTNSSLQISIFQTIKSSTFHIFLNLTYPLKKKILCQNAQNHPRIYIKPPKSSYDYKHRDLALPQTWARYWRKGPVKRGQNSLHVYPRRLKMTDSVKLLERNQVFEILKLKSPSTTRLLK